MSKPNRPTVNCYPTSFARSWTETASAKSDAACERIDVGDVPQQDSAIVSIPIADAADKLRAASIRASVRAGAVRVGFHLYNTENDLDRLLDALGH